MSIFYAELLPLRQDCNPIPHHDYINKSNQGFTEINMLLMGTEKTPS